LQLAADKIKGEFPLSGGAPGIPSCLPLIDTALLISGMLHVQQHFDRDHIEEIEIRSLVDALYNLVEWTWIQVRAPKLDRLPTHARHLYARQEH
jgi:hypothetical protein